MEEKEEEKEVFVFENDSGVKWLDKKDLSNLQDNHVDGQFDDLSEDEKAKEGDDLDISYSRTHQEWDIVWCHFILLWMEKIKK